VTKIHFLDAASPSLFVTDYARAASSTLTEDDFDIVLPPANRKYFVPGFEVIGSILPELKPSRHRSKRVRKKLNKRLSRPLLGPRVIVSLDERVIAQLREKASA
jgi:hypothetical protein